MPRVTIDELHELATQALALAGANADMAAATARALVYADAQGLGSHGVARVAQYAAHLRNGRADGGARPKVASAKGGAVLVDAACGLAYPACALAVQEGIRRARDFGIAFAAVRNSHHFGVAAYHLEAVGSAGLVGLAFGNSPAAMPAAGGRRPVFGTNPIAAIFPRPHALPVLIDLSLSEVARGKLMVAAKEGKKIPLGWALDKHGRPTTDPNAGLEGSMLPVGGAKGAMLRRHLSIAHNLTPAEYRDRWKLRTDYPLVAPKYAARRSELAKALGLGKRGAAGGRASKRARKRA